MIPWPPHEQLNQELVVCFTDKQSLSVTPILPVITPERLDLTAI